MKKVIMIVSCVGFFSLGFSVHGFLDERVAETQPSQLVVMDDYEEAEPEFEICSEFMMRINEGKQVWDVRTEVKSVSQFYIYLELKSGFTYEQAQAEKCRQHKEAQETIERYKALKSLKCDGDEK